VGHSSGIVQPPHARTIDLAGYVVTPGFIDMHYHVTTGAMRYRRTASGALDSTYDRALAERLLRVALSRGITTLRDPGASPVTEAVSLRHDVRNGRIPGPRIFTAGPILSSPRLSAEEIRSSIRDQSRAGVDLYQAARGHHAASTAASGRGSAPQRLKGDRSPATHVVDRCGIERNRLHHPCKQLA
jgi:imidazolonepropionase-like amidohydrolase